MPLLAAVDLTVARARARVIFFIMFEGGAHEGLVMLNQTTLQPLNVRLRQNKSVELNDSRHLIGIIVI